VERDFAEEETGKSSSPLGAIDPDKVKQVVIGNEGIELGEDGEISSSPVTPDDVAKQIMKGTLNIPHQIYSQIFEKEFVDPSELAQAVQMLINIDKRLLPKIAEDSEVIEALNKIITQAPRGKLYQVLEGVYALAPGTIYIFLSTVNRSTINKEQIIKFAAQQSVIFEQFNQAIEKTSLDAAKEEGASSALTIKEAAITDRESASSTVMDKEMPNHNGFLFALSDKGSTIQTWKIKNTGTMVDLKTEYWTRFVGLMSLRIEEDIMFVTGKDGREVRFGVIRDDGSIERLIKEGETLVMGKASVTKEMLPHNGFLYEIAEGRGSVIKTWKINDAGIMVDLKTEYWTRVVGLMSLRIEEDIMFVTGKDGREVRFGVIRDDGSIRLTRESENVSVDAASSSPATSLVPSVINGYVLRFVQYAYNRGNTPFNLDEAYTYADSTDLAVYVSKDSVKEVFEKLTALGFFTHTTTRGVDYWQGVPEKRDELKQHLPVQNKVVSSPAADFEKESQIQTSVSEPYGGIDLNPDLLDLQIKRDGNGVPLPIFQQPIETMNIQGFLPVIINVTPVTNLPALLGLNQCGEEESCPSSNELSFLRLQPMDKKDRLKV